MGSKRPTGLSQLTIDLDRAEKDEPPYSRRRSLTGEIEGCTHIHFAECRQRVRSRLGHHVHPGGAVDDHILTSQCRTPLLLLGQITHLEHRNTNIHRPPDSCSHRMPVISQALNQPRAYKAGGAGDENSLAAHQFCCPALPIASVTTKQIPRVYFFSHILELNRAAVGYHHITQLLESFQIVDHPRTKEGFIFQHRLEHHHLDALSLDALHHALNGRSAEVV